MEISPNRKVSPRAALADGRGAAPQQRLDAGEQFRHLERLDEVVVGAKLQPDDAIDDLSARGQHQDRRLHPALAERSTHVETACRPAA